MNGSDTIYRKTENCVILLVLSLTGMLAELPDQNR